MVSVVPRLHEITSSRGYLEIHSHRHLAMFLHFCWVSVLGRAGQEFSARIGTKYTHYPSAYPTPWRLPLKVTGTQILGSKEHSMKVSKKNSSIFMCWGST